MSQTPYRASKERYHKLSITSQASDLERSSEQPPLDSSQAPYSQQTQQSRRGGDERDEDDEDDPEEDEDDDGPVGPWELSQSFRASANANGKKRRCDEEDDEPSGGEEGEEEISPTTAGGSEGSASGGKGDERSSKVARRVEEEDEEIRVGSRAENGGGNGDRMDVDPVERQQNGERES